MRHAYAKRIAAIGLGVLMIALAGCKSDSSEQIKAFPGDQVKQIHIRADGQNIKVRPSDDKQLKLSMQAKDKLQLPAALKDGVLTVEVKPPSGIIHLKTTTLYVEVPAESYPDLKLATTSGSIIVEDVKAKELILTADSGTIKVSGFEGKIDASTRSGKIKSSLATSSEVQSKDGGYILKASIGPEKADAPRLEIRSTSGNIDLD